ncbi:MAG: hypothetical protein V4649_00510 [Bacteroidota bacterium]
MNWFSKLIGKKEEKENQAPGDDGQAARMGLPGLEGIRFGRYSDNNKSRGQTQSWYKAEELFKQKQYKEAFESFFFYLHDEEENNVVFKQDGDKFTFDLLQGSKKVHGECDGTNILCCVPLAQMSDPITAVMRRLLEMNFNMYYCRTSMDEHNVLCMIFDTDVHSVDTSKLYYGLRELSTKSDRMDDLLLADFNTLKAVGTDHITHLSAWELEFKYSYFRRWIEEGLKRIDGLNQDAFSGAIAYLLPVILYRTDFLITPEAKLLAEMERISTIYWARKEDTTLVERNQMMKDSIRKLLDITKEEFSANVYHAKSTFSISAPPKTEKIRDNIYNANKDSHWYIDNKYPDIALSLVEYGVLYSQFIYSMPSVLTELTSVFMAVLHTDFFAECGLPAPLYEPIEKKFNKEAIEETVDDILKRYKDKFKGMKWDFARMKYDNLYEFAISFSEQMASMNLETKR